MKKSEKTEITVVLKEKVKMHETIIPKLFDFMLYGIAEGEKLK